MRPLLLTIVFLLITSSAYAQPWFIDRDLEDESRIRVAKWKTIEQIFTQDNGGTLSDGGGSAQRVIIRYDSLGRMRSRTSRHRERIPIEGVHGARDRMTESRFIYNEAGDLAMREEWSDSVLASWTVIFYDAQHRQRKRQQYFRGTNVVHVNEFTYENDGYAVDQSTSDGGIVNDFRGEINAKAKFRYVEVVSPDGDVTYAYRNRYYEDSTTLKEQRDGTDSIYSITHYDRQGRVIKVSPSQGEWDTIVYTIRTEGGLEITEGRRQRQGNRDAGGFTEHRDPHGNVVYSRHVTRDPHGRRGESSNPGPSTMRIRILERWD